jgi:tetratricopeptide (TPR) repeat protein
MAALMESYLDVSRNVEAVELGEETLARYRKVYGEDHPGTINPMDYLASAYSGANRHEEAIIMGKEVLALREKLYGRRHPSTLSAMNNLSLHYMDAARSEEAVIVLEEALGLSRDVNGDEHPRTLRVMSNLANGYRVIGRLEEVVAMGNETLDLRAKVLGVSNPETRRTMLNLVLSYWTAEQRVEALELQEKVVALCREVSGSEHPTTLEAMHDLARLYDLMGQQEQALDVGEELLTIQRRVYGEDHPTVFRSMRSLLRRYSAADRVGDALNLQDDITAARMCRLAHALEAYPGLAPMPPEICDLSEFFNADLAEDWHNFDDLGNNLGSLPRGLQMLGGVTFEVRAIVQLSSTNLAVLQPEYPAQVTGIRVGQRAASLHFLHGTGWPLHDDNGADVVTEIGRYVVHYNDGQTAEIPIRYGEHVRNWKFWPEGEAREHGGATPVWKGPQARWQHLWPNTGVRLYHTSWENPRPDATISSIDFISTMTGSAPFLLAITVQPPVLAGVTPKQ